MDCLPCRQPKRGLTPLPSTTAWVVPRTLKHSLECSPYPTNPTDSWIVQFLPNHRVDCLPYRQPRSGLSPLSSTTASIISFPQPQPGLFPLHSTTAWIASLTLNHSLDGLHYPQRHRGLHPLSLFFAVSAAGNRSLDCLPYPQPQHGLSPLSPP